VKLNISSNALTGSVPNIAGAKKLSILDLSNNQLTGPVPADIADHPALRVMDLRVNELSGLPTAWEAPAPTSGSQPPLSTILLSDNPLAVRNSNLQVLVLNEY